NLTRDTIAAFRENLELFLETFAENMGDRFRDQKSLHLSSVGWQALGLTAHDLFVRLRDLDNVDRMRVIGRISRLDWSRSNEDMFTINVLTRVGPDKEVGMSGRGVAAVEALHKYIRERTGLDKMLPEDDADDVPGGVEELPESELVPA